MDEEKIIRERLIGNLFGGNAHMTFDQAVENFPLDRINDIFPNGEYSSWHLLEHIQRTQNDILEFIISSNYRDKEWPKDYWPGREEKAAKKDWDNTIDDFHKDLKKLIEIVKNPKTNLYEKIAWGTGQNIFREILLVSDHSAYHIGEFAIIRQVMGTWRSRH